MSISLPNGATIAIGSTYGATKTLSAFSNANPGVATLEASHGVIVGDIIEITNGWDKSNGNVYRASVVATNDVSIEGLNTTSTTFFPAGSGTGTVREVTGWTQITQVLELTTNGGDQNFATYSFLESSAEHQIPTTKSPVTFNLVIGDDASLPHYTQLNTADADRAQRVLKITLPSGSLIYFSAYVTLQKTPTLTKNEVMGLRSTLSVINEVTRYAS